VKKNFIFLNIFEAKGTMIRITDQDIIEIGQILNIAKDSGITTIRFLDNSFRLTIEYPRYINKYKTQEEFRKILQQVNDRLLATGLFYGYKVTSTESVNFYLKDEISGESSMRHVEKGLKS